MTFEKLVDGLRGAEGPLVLKGGAIGCLETLGGTLIRVDQGHVERLAVPGGGPNGAAIGPDGRCYICNNGGLSPAALQQLTRGLPVQETRPAGNIQVIDLGNGSVSTLYEACDGRSLISPNDLVFDAEGGFYFSDYNDIGRPGYLPGWIYYATWDGQTIRRVTPDLSRPNGVGLSPDGKSLYVAETVTGRLWCFPVLEPGKLGTGTALFRDATLSFDSLAVQADGRVCVACPSANAILRVAQDGSHELIPTPPGGPTNLCFGGPDGRTAYVTLMFSGEVHVAPWDSPGLTLNFQPG